MNLLNTTETAQRLGISVRRVLALIEEGKLKAQKVGRDYAIEEKALEGVKVYGKPGRPPKTPDTDKRATGQIRRTNGASTGKKKGGKK
jgi:excisionase family DNA binding protein